MSAPDDPEYQAMKEREAERENQLSHEISRKSLELLALCDELRWGDGTAIGMAVGYIEAIGLSNGFQLSDELRSDPESKRRRSTINARAVWDRDGWRCVACGTHKNLTVDHIHPVSLGGSDDMDNLQTLCGSCNSRKGARI